MVSTYDISVIVNAHNEGILAHQTMRSLLNAKELAEKHGISVEVLVILDNPSPSTVCYFEENKLFDFERHLVFFGDLGKARMAGIGRAKGDWIANLDADDLWSSNWLVESFHYASRDVRNIIWHPEINQLFGLNPHQFLHVDMEDPDFDIYLLSAINYWTSLVFARRSLFHCVPYPETNLPMQLGFEDWSWNINSILHGAIHKIVPGTVHFIRQKSVSLVKKTADAQCLPNSLPLFRNILEHKQKYPRFTVQSKRD